MKKAIFTTLILFLLSFLVASNVFAQTEPPCGNISAPSGWDINLDPEEPLETNPITNCENPFEVTDAGQSPDELFIQSNRVLDNDVIEITGLSTNDYSVRFDFSNEFIRHQAILFKHDEADYRYVSREPLPPTEEDYRQLANQFFTDQNDIENAVTRIMSPDPWAGLEYGSEEFTKIDDFYTYVQNNLEPSLPPLGLGIYTLVFKLSPISSSWHQTVIRKLTQLFIPIAYAATPGTYKITFTLKNPTPEPVGASSVLFLPGIMGSRLYEDADACGGGSTETELWITRNDCKQLRLATTFIGESINNVYTKSNASSVIDEGFGANLYKTFISNLTQWKMTGVIDDYTLVAYDWRLQLDELLKAKLDTSTGKIIHDSSNTIQDGYLYKAIEKLVASSTTGKVTIVAHSNGGLLAKALLANLKIMNDPLLLKIDNLIMIGSPQLGTPSTLLGLLHGDEIGPLGSVVSQQTTRTLMNTMPFANHLLPSNSYFNGTGVTVKTPIIIFENGTTTTPFDTSFGNSISTVPALQAFLTNSSGRIKPAANELEKPEVVDSFLFNYSSAIHQLIDNWVPPDTMQVHQIAGVGIPTMTGLTYFTDKECATRSFPNLFKCATYKSKLGMRPNETIDGDQTVVTPSALGMSDSNTNVKKLWLNLFDQNDKEFFNRVHKDIFEVQDVINFVKNTIEATTSAPYLYLTTTAPNLPSEDRLVFDLHSPLDLSVVTSVGVISSSSVTIDGATYRRFGEMQHISMLNTAGKKNVVLNGKATGSFTLEITEQQDSSMTKRHTYSAIPSSTSTKVTLELDSAKPIDQAILIVDYDGNGSPEIIYNTAGEVVPEVSYLILKTAVNRLNISSFYKKLLLENIKIAEQYQINSVSQPKLKKLEVLALNVLKQQVIFYERLKVLTPIQRQELVGIIDKLIIK